MIGKKSGQIDIFNSMIYEKLIPKGHLIVKIDSIIDFSFWQLLNDKELRQSMSRRGNCWDNAPREYFFGHMKDEIHLEQCHIFFGNQKKKAESIIPKVNYPWIC